MNIILDILSDNSERVPYNRAYMPIFAGKGRLSSFLNYTAPGHWHDDIEFSIVLSGRMYYNINGKIHIIEPGDGVFVNSRQFHSSYSIGGLDCEYICALLHPILLCANQFIETNFVAPVISNDGFAYSLLDQYTSWKAALMADVCNIYKLYKKQEKTSELLVQSLFFHIWSILYTSMPNKVEPAPRSNNHLTALRDMIGFLQKHYGEKITLQHIAAAGGVSQSTCCVIFGEYLHQTPIQYLIGYRLNKSAELLKNTAKSISEIASETGFKGVSYFAETFKKNLGRSPTEYRKWID